MKKIAAIFLLACPLCHAQSVPISITKTSGSNVISNGPVSIGAASPFTVNSGATLTVASGGVLTVASGATINIAGSVNLANLTLTNPIVTGGTFSAVAGFGLRAGGGFDLTLVDTETLTANRSISFITGDASRSITFNGNPTLGDWFNQPIKTTSSPTLAALSLNGALTTSSIVSNSSITMSPASGQDIVLSTSSGGNTKVYQLAWVQAGANITASPRVNGRGLTVGTTNNNDFTFSIFRNSIPPYPTNIVSLEFEGLDAGGSSVTYGEIDARGINVGVGTVQSELVYLLTKNGSPGVVDRMTPVLKRFYNTYTSDTVFESLDLDWTSNLARIFTNYSGGGSSSRPLQIGAGGTQWQFSADGTNFSPIADDSSSSGSLGTASNRIYRSYIGDRLVVGNATGESGLLYARASGGNYLTMDATNGNVTITGTMTVPIISSSSGISIDPATGQNILLVTGGAGNTQVNQLAWVYSGAHLTASPRSNGRGVTFATTDNNDFTLSIFQNNIASAPTTCATLEFEGLDSVGGSVSYGEMLVNEASNTAGSASGEIQFGLSKAGTFTNLLDLTTTSLSFFNTSGNNQANWEALVLDWNANFARIYAAASGTGTSRALRMGAGPGPSWEFTSDGVAYRPITDASSTTGYLGDSSHRIYRAYVSDRLVVGNATSESGMIYARPTNGTAFVVNATTGAISVSDTSVASSTITGSGTFAGGIGIAGAAYIGGDIVETTTRTPASSAAAGTTGTYAWDSNYVYVCIATNTWKRVAISTW